MDVNDLDPRQRPFLRPDELPAFGFGTVKSVYGSIRRGEIPAQRFGHRLLIPTAWVRRAMQLDDPPAA